MTADDLDPETRRNAAALALFGCPRPDKYHHLTAEAAQARLDYAITHKPAHDATAEVYRCACGGWVWGRPHKRTTP